MCQTAAAYSHVDLIYAMYVVHKVSRQLPYVFPLSAERHFLRLIMFLRTFSAWAEKERQLSRVTPRKVGWRSNLSFVPFINKSGTSFPLLSAGSRVKQVKQHFDADMSTFQVEHHLEMWSSVG